VGSQVVASEGEDEVTGEGEDKVAGEGEGERRAEAEGCGGSARPRRRAGRGEWGGEGARVPVSRRGLIYPRRRRRLGFVGGLHHDGGLIAVGDDGPAGSSGPLGLVPAHGPHRAQLFRAVLGQHYGLELQPSKARRRARAGPGPKKSCWARARVGPNCRAMGRPMLYP
jgi:hypothetical protein